jgi:hypothetical protein
MYPRNNASPERLAIGQVILIADGTVQSSSVVITVRGQGGSEGTGGGTTVYGGDNTVYYTPTQAETNFTSFTIIASKASCISSSMTVITSAASTPGQVDLKSIQGTAQTANDNGLDINTLITQVGTAGAGLTNLGSSGNNWNTVVPPTVSEFNNRTIASADYTVVSDLGTVQTGDTYALAYGAEGFSAINTDVETILSRIIGTLATGTHNPASTAQLAVLTDWINGGRLDLLLDAIPTTAMRGTDNAALASLVTSARMGALTDWIDGGRLDVLLDAIPTTAMRGTDSGPTNTQMVAAFTEIKGSSFNNSTDSLEAIRDRGDSAWTTGAGGSSPTVVQIRQEMDSNSTKLADIVEDTNELQTDNIPGLISTLDAVVDTVKVDTAAILVDTGTTLPARLGSIEGASFSTSTDSLEAIRDRGDSAWITGGGGGSGGATPAEVATALTDIHLDKLFANSYDPASKPGSATALLNELVENDGGVARYTVNALENGPSGSGSSAEVIAAAVWDTLQSAHKISGTYGLYLQSNSGYVPASGHASGLTSETAPFNAYEYGQVIRANMKQDVSAFTVFEIVIQPEQGYSKNASQLPNRPKGAIIASGSDVTVGTVDVTIGDVLYAANEYLEYTTKINDLSHPGTWRVRGTVVKSAANKLLGDFLRFTVLD